MVAVSAEEIKEMRARNAEYVRHRMRIPITDEQYLLWDDILTNYYDEALEVYQSLLAQNYYQRRNRCYDPGLLRGKLTLKVDDKRTYAHRFTYVIRVSLPLSSKQVIRHQCANERCLNAAHIEVGDQAQNFQDLLAARAYGVRWDLLPRSALETIK